MIDKASGCTMHERVYFCGSQVQECVRLCDKANEILAEDIDAVEELLRNEHSSSCTPTSKCKAKSTVNKHDSIF